MSPAPLPPNEKERLEALAAYDILDTSVEEAYDDLVALAAELCDVPIALFTLVDDKRQWFKASFGLGVRETSRDVAFCAYAVLHGELFVVHDATHDERFSDNPLVTGDPSIRFYAGAPLRSRGGHPLGTLCVIDRRPRQLTERQAKALERLRRQGELLLELRLRARELSAAQAELRAEHDAVTRLQRKRSDLARLLVRDLNNPLAVVLSNTRYLAQQTKLPGDWRETLRDVVEAGYQVEAMSRDVLDVGAAEDGDLLLRLERFDLEKLVLETTGSVAAASQGKKQTLTVSLKWGQNEIRADRELVRRTLENLVGRALRSTPPGGTIEVEGVMMEGDFGLRLRDGGPLLPPQARERIFDPYLRVDFPARAGLFDFDRGMGLSFCKAAVEAHGGTIWVEENTPLGNVFCLRLPADGERRG